MKSNRNSRRLTVKERNRIRIWKSVRPSIITAAGILIAFLVSWNIYRYVYSHFLSPVDVHDATPIEVVIPSSSSASKIASILYNARGEDEEGLISNTAVFKVYVDFVGKAGKMQAGTYILSRNMSIKQIVDIICEGNPPKATVKITIPEGYGAVDIARVLLEKGLIENTQSFLSVCNHTSAFSSFAFITDISRSSRRYLLEGYLFPDTYEVYEDSGPESIIIKMLNRFNEIFTDADLSRAEELNMTPDQVVTLASLIEKEAQAADDFAKVSAVFHNRLHDDMPLQSCASLSYVLNLKKYTFTEAELATQSPYNTYLFTGLPVGPVCNPGRTAIQAALYPNEDFLEGHYLYFCNGNLKETNELVFSKTYEEHQANVRQYQQYWE